MTPKHLSIVLLILAPFVLSGCNAKQKIIEENELRSLGLRYHNFTAVNKRGPMNLDELAMASASFGGPGSDTNASGLEKARDGKYVVFWNYDVSKDLEKNETVVLAHEKDTAKSKVLVCYASGMVRRISKADFDAAEKANSYKQ